MYSMSQMGKVKKGKLADEPIKKGDPTFNNIYMPRPMPEEMKKTQHPAWMYSRDRRYIQPLMEEPYKNKKKDAIDMFG